jgi:serine/threonine protein kinase
MSLLGLTLPGYELIAHLSRTRRLDTYEVWSRERACSCVVKTLRPDRRDDERARAALHYLHRRGVLHLDVKPANVIAEAGRAKLIDLSLARPPGRYRAGLGAWCNLSPEQARGDELGPPAGVWGLGTVLYEAATGRVPFDDDDGSWTGDSGPSGTWHTDDQLEAGYPQLEGPAPPITGVQDDLAAAIAACLAPEPADRPTLTELAALLVPLAPGARRWDA